MEEFLIVLACATAGAAIVHFTAPELIGALFGALIGVVLAFVNTALSNRESMFWAYFDNDHIKDWFRRH